MITVVTGVVPRRAPSAAGTRAIHLEGGLLGPDILERLEAGALPGQRPADFGIRGGRSVLDEAAEIYRDARDLWKVFRRRLERLPEEDPATSLTREGWAIPFLSLLGYELRYNPRAYDVDGVTFAISHRAGENEDAPPIHIAGARRELGRVDPSGRPRMSPHALMQEFLNRSEHLWGIVTNGRLLRLLRKSTLLRRQAYIQFDLEAIFEAEGDAHFHDFVLLYRLLHRSRLPRGIADAAECWLERYHRQAMDQGNRARDRLRDGVERSLQILGTGFLRANPGWSPSPESLYQDLLRLVYRFLFLLVAEERGLLGGSDLYREHYSISRLRRLVDRREAYTEHDDLWHSLCVLWHLFRDATPVPQAGDQPLASLLGLSVLNGGLFERISLEERSIPNRDLLEAFYYLAYYYDDEARTWRRVNYAALDVEELGSVYESLLDNHPQIVPEPGGPALRFSEGTERKSTGSYYTPPELVQELVKSALEPVLEERLAEAKRMAEEVKRVASSEWRVVVDTVRKLIGGTHANTVLSRLGSLAKSHGFSRTHLSHDQGVSERRAVRPDEPDAPGSNIGAGQHLRGMGAPGYEGISSVPQHRGGQSAGTGDLSDLGATSSPGSGSGSPTHNGIDPGSQPSTGQPSAQSQKEKVTSPYEASSERRTASSEWRVASSGEESGHSPIPTRHSPHSDHSSLAHFFAAFWSALPLTTRHSLLAQSFAEQAILSIRVLDPACGSGHFLLAAARRLGKELARVRTGEEEPSPEALREATREVIAHCIYGVDKNPLAVELCRVALWIEGHVPGKPLTFLDHRIRCGDSLVGIWDPAVLKEGIPDGAYDPVADDDRGIARALKRRNEQERAGQQGLFGEPLEDKLLESALEALELDKISDDSVEAIAEKQRRFNAIRHSLFAIRQAANLWTAAFFQRIGNGEWRMEKALTTRLVWAALTGRAHPQAVAVAEDLATRLHFFHWPLEFPEVFADGGFDVVLCNPPWERIKLQEEEFFAARDPEIARAPNKAERARRIKALQTTNPALWQEYQHALHDADALSKFLRASGRFPLTARGDINTYSVFAELFAHLLRPEGRAGVVVPTGIATDATNQQFFAHLVDSGRLVSLYDFENREGLFPAVDSRYKFSLLTLRGQKANGESRISPAQFAFFLTRADQLRDPQRRFALTAEDFALLNPNTRTCPVFRTRQDAELTKAIYRRVPVLVNERTGENPWGVRFLAMFHMANHSHLFRTRHELEREGFRLVGNVFVKGDPHSPFAIRYSPLYEAKMIWHYDHRYGTYEGVASRSSTQLPTPDEAQHADPCFLAQPWYWVPAEEVEARLEGWNRGWLLGFRNVTNTTNERTAIFTLLPRVGVGNSAPIVILGDRPAFKYGGLVANLASLVFDHAARNKIAGVNMNFFYVEQLPVLPPSAYTHEDLLFIVPRVLELVYTAWDLKPFADDVWAEADAALREAITRQWQENRAATNGVDPTPPEWLPLLSLANSEWRIANGREARIDHSPFAVRHSPSEGIPLPPFKWDEPRRARLRAELDAFYARLYGLTRKQLRYILDPADLTERELQDILDPWEEVTDPLDPQGYAERVAKSTFPGETFRVLKEKELRQFGEYRTRRLVLEAWERLSNSERRVH